MMYPPVRAIQKPRLGRQSESSRTANFAQLHADVAIPDCATLATLADPFFGANDAHETLVIGGMNAAYRLIWIESFSQSQSQVSVTLQQLEYHLMRSASCHIFLAHNHPTGIALPSQTDIRFTRVCAKIARHNGQNLIDHIIRGANHWGSMRAMGLL